MRIRLVLVQIAMVAGWSSSLQAVPSPLPLHGPVDCTDSSALPVVDGVLAVASGVGGYFLFQSQRESVAGDPWGGVFLMGIVVSTLAVAVGFIADGARA